MTLLERTPDGGRKILISGGGRCNVLPMELDAQRFQTDSSSNTLKKILRSWPLAEQRSFFEQDLRLPLKEEADSRKLFPVSDRARDVRDALVAEARRAGADLRFRSTIETIDRDGDGSWRVALTGNESIHADRIVLATGGLSVPQTGSDGTGLSIAERLGLSMTPPYAALTPLTQQPAAFASLSGVSATVTLRAKVGKRRREAHGGFLFTHRGFSGPAVLDISDVAVRAHEAGEQQVITVQWTELDAGAWSDLFDRERGTPGSLLRGRLPTRLADALLAEAGVSPEQRLAEMSRRSRNRLIEVLSAWPLPWTGHEGYRKAEVTGGGVQLSEVNPRTLEAKKHPGLFLCGEILDAFGPIGGFNFAWAWATGRAAGLGAAPERNTHGTEPKVPVRHSIPT